MNQPSGPFLGAHMSIAGGVSTAMERAQKVGASALALFTKNSNQWKGAPILAEEADKFQRLRAETNLPFAFAHDSYLINLASPDEMLRSKSMTAFLDEMDRAELLGLDFVVFHPGAHVGSGVEEGCRKVADALNRVIDQRQQQKVMLLIENAAGQGSCLGCAFEDLAMIRDQVENKERVGFCLDTCHTFAAGYDIRTSETYEKTMATFDRVCGLEHIRAFHINDSKKDLNCRVDRHEHIGKGKIGLDAFRSLLNDDRFKDRPMVLETPKSLDLHEDIENLSILRSLMC